MIVANVRPMRIMVCSLLAALFLAACGESAPPPATEGLPSAVPTSLPTLEPTSLPTLEPSPTPMPLVEIINNLRYNGEAALDIYRPTQTNGPVPVILAFHGGNDNKSRFFNMGYQLAELGYALVSVGYHDTLDYAYPLAVTDAFCAMAWVHANAATYQFDTDRVFALGHSSGGTLAAMLGVVDDPDIFMENCPQAYPQEDGLRGVVTYTGIFDYSGAASYGEALAEYFVGYLGSPQADAPEIWAEASAITWLDGSEPPFLLIHGAGDASILPAQSEDFAAALETLGIEVQLLLIPGADHMMIIKDETATQALVTFLEQHSGQ